MFESHSRSERIFVYFDAPQERVAFESATSHDARIVSVAVDERLIQDGWWRLGPAAAEWLQHAQHEVQARQALNALHALHACVADGSIGWLLHMDADELFHVEGGDARAHFRALATRGVEALTS